MVTTSYSRYFGWYPKKQGTVRFLGDKQVNATAVYSSQIIQQALILFLQALIRLVFSRKLLLWQELSFFLFIFRKGWYNNISGNLFVSVFDEGVCDFEKNTETDS